MLILERCLILLAVCLSVACVHMPSGPSVMILPGAGKNFDQFRSDEYGCRQYAYEQVGGETPRHVSSMSGVKSASIAAGLGAAVGAVLGGGHGAAVGAGTGLLLGGLLGSHAAEASGYASQQRYDHGYVQCMYAKGHRVPVDGRMMNHATGYRSAIKKPSMPAANFIPPPPPRGNPPPPPR